MRMRKLVPLFCFVAVFAGCATAPKRPSQEAYSLIVTDNFPERRFDIRLVSSDQRELCLVVEQWPSRVGQLHMGSEIASVTTDAAVYFAIDENFGYCPGGCGELVIPPGGELKGFISYSAFEGGLKISEQSKKSLNFSVQPYYCRNK